MNRRVAPPLLPGIIVVLLAIGAGAAVAQQPPNGNEILKNVDETMSAPRDQDVEATLILVDKDGNRKERTLRMYQKGADTRMARFLTPADQKGISVLSLPDGSIYLYLPAFKKVKRIASHVKNTEFASTDFTYDDMEAKRYSDIYTAELSKTEGSFYVLSLTPKDRAESEYSKLMLWVVKDNFVPSTIEYYNLKGALSRRMTSEGIEKVGAYWVARVREMNNLEKNHKTRMIINTMKFDTGLSDEIFTTRYLER